LRLTVEKAIEYNFFLLKLNLIEFLSR